MTTSPFFNTLPIISEAFNNGPKSGFLKWSMGVGTVTMNVLQAANSVNSDENFN